MDNILRDIPNSFESERLLIRAPRPGDGAMVNAAVLDSLAELRPWMVWAQQTPTVDDNERYTREAHIRFLKREELPLLLFLKGTEILVGSAGLHNINWNVPKFEIGYWARTPYAGQGYITEAVAAITEFAFTTLGANRVEISCDAKNERSAAVARRGGFPLEGTLRNEDRCPMTNELRDTLVFAKISSESNR
jgi:RimJ/RimL family protein N-acetyltransferase